MAFPASWGSSAGRRPFGLPLPRLSPGARSALRATVRLAGVVRWVMLVVATVIMGGVTVASLLGFRIMIVTSGSMLPTFGPGDAVMVRPGRVADVKAGDVITFRAPGTPGMTTHRVLSVRIFDGTRWFQTKGDANPTTDPNLVPAGAVYGTQRLALPKLGRFLYLALTPEGKLMLLGLPISFLAAQELGILLRARRRRRQHLPAELAPVHLEVRPEQPDVPQGVDGHPEPVILPDPAAPGSPTNAYVRMEGELRAQSARLAAAEDALAELERKVAELAADNRHVRASDDLPPMNKGLERQVALSG